MVNICEGAVRGFCDAAIYVPIGYDDDLGFVRGGGGGGIRRVGIVVIDGEVCGMLVLLYISILREFSSRSTRTFFYCLSDTKLHRCVMRRVTVSRR